MNDLVAAQKEELPSSVPDAQARLLAAERLVKAHPATWLGLTVDLRPALAGRLTSARRRGNNQDRFYHLPWLLLRGEGLKVRVARWAHCRLQRSFSGGQLISNMEGNELDEAIISRASGTARVPLARLERLTGEILQAPVGAPPPSPWPATAPSLLTGPPLAAPLGLLTALLLLVVCPLLLAPPSRPPTPPSPRQLEQLQAGPAPQLMGELREQGPQAQHTVLRAGLSSSSWARRNALASCSILAPLQRLRLLTRCAQDPDQEVRLLAIELLGREGEAGASALARVHEESQAPLELRLQALRLLLDRDDPRAVELALRGLQGSPGVHAALRRAWLGALRSQATRRGELSWLPVLEKTLSEQTDSSALTEAALAHMLVSGKQAGGWRAFTRTRQTGHQLAQARLLGALIRQGLPRETLESLQRLPDLHPLASRALRRALGGS